VFIHPAPPTPVELITGGAQSRVMEHLVAIVEDELADTGHLQLGVRLYPLGGSATVTLSQTSRHIVAMLEGDEEASRRVPKPANAARANERRREFDHAGEAVAATRQLLLPWLDVLVLAAPSQVGADRHLPAIRSWPRLKGGSVDTSVAARWSRDPSGMHELRWWDGSQWTGYVTDAGAVTVDASTAVPPNFG
jgi:hypothetical protein